MNGYRALLVRHPHLIAFGMLMAFCSSFGQTFFISVFGAEWRRLFDLGNGGFGTIYSVATLSSACLLPWVGRLIDDMPLKRYASIVICGLAFACLLAGLAPGAIGLGIAFFALRLTGQGLMTHTAVTTMARRFEVERGRAISLSMLGLAGGEMVFPLMGLAGLAIGWRYAWLAFALVLVGGLLPGVRGLLDRGGESGRHAGPGTAPASDTTEPVWGRKEVLSDLRFYLVLPGILAPAFIVTGIFFHQSFIVASKGWSPAWFASCFIAYSLATVAASLVGGALTDKLTARRLLPLTCLTLAAGPLVLASGTSSWIVLAMMCVLGLSQGAQSTAASAVWAELYGVTHLGAIRALAASLMVLGSALSPAILGWLFDAGVSVNAVALGCAGYAAASSPIMLMALRRPGRLRRPARAAAR